MKENLGTNMMESVERIFRYLIPGVSFSVLFALSYPDHFDTAIQKISNSEISQFLVVLTIGMSLYAFESQIIRFTLEPIAYLLNKSPVNIFSEDRCLCNYSKALSKLLINRENSSDYPKGYYIYLWSLVHYSFILSALLLLFASFHGEESWAACNAHIMGIAGALILLLAVCSYGYMQILEKNTTHTLKLNEG